MVFIQELKRQLHLKRLLVYLILSLGLAGLWANFIIGGATEGFMQSGCYKGYRGKEAIDRAAIDRKSTSGKMTQEHFQKACTMYLSALEQKGEDRITVNKELLKYTVYADILITQEYRIRTMEGRSLEGLAHIPPDAGTQYYANEDWYYRQYIQQHARTQQEKDVALGMWDKVEKPYTYYSGYKQWSEGLTHILLLSFVLMVIVAIFASSIIARDQQSGIDEIITTTIYGRKKLTLAKIVIPWLMAILVYLCGVGGYVMLLRYGLPHRALDTSIQVSSESFLPLNLRQIFSRFFLVGGLGILTISSFSTWLSSRVKKSSVAVQLAVFTLIGALILGLFINTHQVAIDVLKMFIPGGILFQYLHYMELNSFPLVTLWGKVFWMPTVLVAVSLFICLLSTVFTWRRYRRR